MPDSYCVGDWLVEPSLLRLSRNGEVKKVEPQLMAVLQQLASRPGQVVTKEHLRKTAWADVIVTDNVLTRAISSLRKILEDDRTHPRYIETISKTGYRMIAVVRGGEPLENNKIFTIKLAKKPVFITIGIALLVALGAFGTREVFSPKAAPKNYHPMALANYSNTEYWPAISPDGKFVAYGWKGKANDNWDIYAKLIGTETILRITDHPATDLRAKWSPDGNYIYFLHYENGGSTIYRKSAVGEEETRILAAPKYSFGNFDISPDEKWISFNDREDRSSPARLKLISLGTGEEQWLTTPAKGFNGDIHPTFSPDGLQLAFIREKNAVSMQLWLYDLVTGELEQITSEHLSINGFDWLEDGKALLYSTNKSGLYKLWEVNLSTKKTNVLQVGDYQMVMPRVAETGRVAYAKMEDKVNIWSYNLKHKTAKTWHATNGLNLNPVFAPNGKKVCFTANKDHIFQLWVANPDGTEAIPITRFIGEYLSAPCWSSDSESILFQGYLNGQTDIYKVNARGGVPENLTRSGADDHTPFVANNKIYFSSNRSGEWGIWSMDADGSRALQIIGDNAYAPKLNLDESMLYFCKKDTLGLWAFNLEKKEAHLIIEAFHPKHWGTFTVAKKGIYYLNAANKRFEFFDFDTGQSSLVYQPQKRIAQLGITLSLSPDAEQLLFCQVDHNDADIMLLENDPNN